MDRGEVHRKPVRHCSKPKFCCISSFFGHSMYLSYETVIATVIKMACLLASLYLMVHYRQLSGLRHHALFVVYEGQPITHCLC